ncbi:ABC transporter ATP-binding protein [Streptomyces sp. NPDC059874]|uniref:ABC transporter ATP-binding protein n=1 Tax=Streptomyces sp. NPDC059874 TaxID=3346983 RepID=UPI00365A13A7
MTESTTDVPPPPLIELRDITKTFPGTPPVTALTGVTASVAPGEMVAVTGSSGSGKSTLLNVLGLLDSPTTGTHLLNGVDVTSLSEQDRTSVRARELGFVFQSFHLIPYLDCVRNVMVPLIHQNHPRHERRALAVQALERVGLGHRLSARPGTLSGGEQQRVAVARAIVHEPRIVLCDEPTGNLDSANTDQVVALLRDLVTEGNAVVVVTHEPDVAQRADRILQVRDGRIQAAPHAP